MALSPEYRQPGVADEDFLKAGPAFVEERYFSSSGIHFRVVNSAGQVRCYPAHHLKRQAVPLVGALVPGPTLPVVGQAVRLNLEGQEIASRPDFFKDQPVVQDIEQHVARLENAAGRVERYNVSLLQRQARETGLRAAGLGSVFQQSAGDPLELLERLTGQAESAGELWKRVQQSPDENALERVKSCFQHACEPAAGANLALKALETPEGLALVERYLQAGGEDPIKSAHHGLELSRELGLSPGQMPWLFEVSGNGYAGDRAILKFLLEAPEGERRQRAGLVKDFLREDRSRDKAERAVSNARDILSMQSKHSPPDELGKLYRSFLEGWHTQDDGLPMSTFQQSGLDEPQKRNDWQRYFDLGLSSKSALELGEFDRNLRRDDLRQALRRLAATGEYRSARVLLADFKLLERADRPPGQSLEDRLSLVVCLAKAARGRPEDARAGLFKVLEQAFPQHEALAAELEGLPTRVGLGRVGGEVGTLTTAAGSRYPGETVAAAGRRLADLHDALPISLETGVLRAAFQWLSGRPREHYQAYQQALTTRLEAECPLEQAQAELDLVRQAPEPVPRALKTLLTLTEGGLAEKGLREALSWVHAQPPQDYADLAGRLLAQSKLTGPLERAMEALERPVSGVREEAGGVTFGGVRLKRRNPAG